MWQIIVGIVAAAKYLYRSILGNSTPLQNNNNSQSAEEYSDENPFP